MSLLSVRDLSVSIGTLCPVDGVSFEIERGETLALLGESGCGKSMTALALMRLLPPGGSIVQGAIHFADEDLCCLTEAQMRHVRGGKLGMIFQEPATSLNPVMTVGEQIAEALRFHAGNETRVIELLAAVGIPDPERRAREYPFQMSGGMKQRAMIAMALAGAPELLIADEPTTALDVTIQAQVLDVLDGLRRARGMAILLITHDLGVVARMADQIGLMYAGQLVEMAPRAAFFAAPGHPYARRLFEALPEMAMTNEGQRRLATIPGSVPPLGTVFTGCRFADRCSEVLPVCHRELPPWREHGPAHRVRCHLEVRAEQSVRKVGAGETASVDVSAPPQALLTVRELKVHFPIRRGVLQRAVGYVRAVDGVDLALPAGRTLALVGESGCGKTTVGKAILGLQAPTAGDIHWQAEKLQGLAPERMQMVFQDPFGSLNPRMRICEIVAEGRPGADVARILEQVSLSASMADRYPHEFSGGQRQRIAIARALAVEPQVLICDEPTSALDVSVQAQILNLLAELQQTLGLSYLFITHNIGVVNHLAHEVAVMYLGRIVERGTVDEVLRAPRHPYTQALLAAVPRIDGQRMDVKVAGDPPSPSNPPAGCHFHPRCPRAEACCREAYPPAVSVSTTQTVNCFFAN
ncbi:MAG: ABC transporter ATP-binding protein [Rhodocyclaceae bacterium]|nr:ABC transporter ATP-binding protein [Rhodocyclaceae bacterium]MDZ4214087.1 ABC transporter ATP-binding protein [Rhodocyclaceae bacterium]